MVIYSSLTACDVVSVHTNIPKTKDAMQKWLTVNKRRTACFFVLIAFFALISTLWIYSLIEETLKPSDPQPFSHVFGSFFLPEAARPVPIDPELLNLRREKYRLNYTRPPIETILNLETSEIIGDPRFLLDFAIVGFGKCGTTTMMNWLADNPQVQIFRNEVWQLMHGRPANLVRLLYDELDTGHFKRGYKV